MVDFDNETTIGVPAADVEKICILQRRHDLIEALEAYKKLRFNRSEAPLHVVRARLLSLFLEIQATLKRRWKKDVYETFERDCFAEELDEKKIIKLIYQINEELDEFRLTRVDNRKTYDETDTEAENREKGF